MVSLQRMRMGVDLSKEALRTPARIPCFSSGQGPRPAYSDRDYSRHQLLANAANAASRVDSQPCVRRTRYAAGGGGGGFGGLGGGGLGGRGGKMATRKVKGVLVVVISVLFCPNLPRPARQRGRAWEAATTAAAAKAAANNS
jgi:hypothetical protein